MHAVLQVHEHGHIGVCHNVSCSLVCCIWSWLLGDDLEDDGWNSSTGCQNKLSREGRGKGVERFFLVSSQLLFNVPWNVSIISFSNKTLNVFITCHWSWNHNGKRSVADPWSHTIFIVLSIIILLKSGKCSVRSIEKYLFQNKWEACLYNILNSFSELSRAKGSNS